MQRINWIDWAKAWCMTLVVFEHTPHDASPFLLQFLAGTNLSVFFFISGYLKKPVTSQKEVLKKYAYCLLLPYIIYNAISYPYWIGKTYIEQEGSINITDCLKPIIGTLLGQLNSTFSCELNGVTWFLISLFAMHWIADFCNRQKHGIIWMACISLIAMILYGANKYYHFAPYLPFHGLVRCIAFFFLGIIFRQIAFLKETEFKIDFTIGTSFLAVSLLFFYWHIHENLLILHIMLYFVVNILSVIAIIYLWRCADGIKSKLITNISIGTMLIFGLHRILIGIIDFLAEKGLHAPDILYNWVEAVLITIAIEAILIPFIIISKDRYPILLGKKSTPQKV